VPLRIWIPQVRGERITSKSQLRKLIDCEFYSLKHRADYSRLLASAIAHLKLAKELENRDLLELGELKCLAQKTNIARSLVVAYVKGARQPLLYSLIDHSSSKTEGQARVEMIERESNGISSVEDITERLDNYFPSAALGKSIGHSHRLVQCQKYFEALNTLKQGGLYSQSARELGMNAVDIFRWFRGDRPHLVELARRVPKEKPADDNKWLPRTMLGIFQPTDFIQVPAAVSEWSDIMRVLGQIRSVRSNAVQHWRQQFGATDKEAAFSYVLGLLVSDAGKTGDYTSTALILHLSRRSPWSERVGEATCHYMAELGIETRKGQDGSSSSGPGTCHTWISKSSSLLAWMKRSCLGLQVGENTTHHPIRAGWLLRAPCNVRLLFLQGLNDGDGCASVKAQCLSNACQPNVEFVKRLLATFQIESTDDGSCVRITKRDSIIRAAELPFFLHATERQTRAKKLASMMRARNNRKRDPPQEAVTTMIGLRNQGESLGAIAEAVYDKYGLSYSEKSISYHLRRMSHNT